MDKTSITFSLKVHGGVTVQDYLENTLNFNRNSLGAEGFNVQRLEQSGIGDDNWYQTRVRITPYGLRQNQKSFISQLESILCGDPNIVVLDREDL